MTKNPGYAMYIVFYPAGTNGAVERRYNTVEEHRRAIIDIYDCLYDGGYCVVTRWNESEIIRTKQQLWEFHI